MVVLFESLMYNQYMVHDIQINLNTLLKTSSLAKTVRIGVALSGGRDSVALLHALLEAGANVIAINVEHGIRGEDSIKDSEFSRRLCESLNVPFFGYKVDAPTYSQENGYTLEQGARILRYEIFDKMLKEGKCDYIALAHHLDDQVETIFMRILRGTGLNGLTGMREVNGRYIRPLLGYTREDIDAYIEAKHLEYVEDETNHDTAYTRNFLRSEITRLKERFPSLCESIARLSKNVQEENDFINSLVPEIYVHDGEAMIGIEELENSPSTIAKRLVMKAVNAMGVYQDIEDRHFALIFDLIDGENGKYICLPHKLLAHKEDESIVFSKRIAKEYKEEQKFTLGKNEVFGVEAILISRSQFEMEWRGEREFGTLYFDIDKLPKEAVIRQRRECDSILKFGGGRKSLGDFLTDKKTPKRQRDDIAVVAVDSEVYIVCGVEISAKIKVDDDTKNIAKLTTIK